MTAEVNPGDERAVVRGDVAVLLGGAPDDTLAVAVWEACAAPGAGVLEVIGVLHAAAGLDLRALSDFVVVAWSGDDVHVAVRGETTVVIDGPEQRTVTGAGALTWSEASVAAATRVTVGAFGSGLPVESGVVAASGFQVIAPGGAPVDGGVSSAVARPAAARAAGAHAAPKRQVSMPPTAPGSAPVPPAPVVAPVAAPVTASASSVEAPAAGAPVPLAPHEPAAPTIDDAADLASPLGHQPDPALDVASTDTWMPELTLHEMPSDAAADAAPAPARPEVVAPPSTQADDEYQHLWLDTVNRSVEEAAIRAVDDGSGDAAPPRPGQATAAAPAAGAPPVPPAAAAGPAVPPPPPPGAAQQPWSDRGPVISAVPLGHQRIDEDDDHDGHTQMSPNIASLRAEAQRLIDEARQSAPDKLAGPRVLARLCLNGHPNPPSSEQCGRCSAVLDSEAVSVPRPPLGRVVVNDGTVVSIDRVVRIGRGPRGTGALDGVDPHLVTVTAGGKDISRDHIEIAPEGWSVLVRDLGSVNGSILRRAGDPPRRLHPNEPLLAVSGDVLDLGSNVLITLDGIL